MGTLSDHFNKREIEDSDNEFDLEYIKAELISTCCDLWQQMYRKETHFRYVTVFIEHVTRTFDQMANVKYKFEPLSSDKWVLREEYHTSV
jgi:hypothetical protein